MDMIKRIGLKQLWFGSAVIGKVMNFIYTFIGGLIIILFFPKFLNKQVAIIDRNWLRCLGYGVVLFIVLPILSICLFMTVLGSSLGLALGALTLIAFYLAKILTIMWASHRIAQKRRFKIKPIGLFAIGLVCYLLITMIPFVGLLVSICATLIGLGTFEIPFKTKGKPRKAR